jgi:hypothetical protein
MNIQDTIRRTREKIKYSFTHEPINDVDVDRDIDALKKRKALLDKAEQRNRLRSDVWAQEHPMLSKLKNKIGENVARKHEQDKLINRRPMFWEGENLPRKQKVKLPEKKKLFWE